MWRSLHKYVHLMFRDVCMWQNISTPMSAMCKAYLVMDLHENFLGSQLLSCDLKFSIVLKSQLFCWYWLLYITDFLCTLQIFTVLHHQSLQIWIMDNYWVVWKFFEIKYQNGLAFGRSSCDVKGEHWRRKFNAYKTEGSWAQANVDFQKDPH